jgi:hypothetical protein
MVYFFRIKESGSIKTPTFTAIVVSFILWLLTIIILRHSMLFAICAMVVEYIFAAIVFSKPLRIPIQKILYKTRYPRIVGGAPSRSATRWLEANREMLGRANISIFRGVGAGKTTGGIQIHGGGFENVVPLARDDRTATWTTSADG